MKIILTFLFNLMLFNAVLAAHLTPSLQINARCSGSNEVPAVTTDGYGLAVVTLASDMRSGELIFQASGLSGAITGIHIHEGNAGNNGPVIYNLTDFLDSNRVSVRLADQGDFSMAKLISGAYYLNVHTEQNPDGEIRGQFNLETDLLFGGALSGENEVPTVNTDAMGYTSLAMSSSGQSMTLTAIFENLSGSISGAHLHNAAMGSNGMVVVDLTSFVSGNMIVVEITEGVSLDELRAGNIYLNIHTELNPDGEIRAQLQPLDGLTFDCKLSGENEVPAVQSDALGLVNFTLDPTTGQINYEGFISSTGSIITGAHLHNAPAGSNGGVVINLSDSISNGLVSGTIANVSSTLRSAMLSGGIYLNVHTTDNPDGEIRGQVLRLLREGYFCQFSGDQQVPPVESQGSGVGMISIDRDQSNGHFMMVVDGISDGFQAAHFHDGGVGMNGDVLFDLTPFFIDGRAAFGYWTEMGDAAVKFRTTGIYANTHTVDNPDGELRGNYLRGSSTQIVEYSGIKSSLFISSNTTGNIGVYNFDYEDESSLVTFPSGGQDADGIYYDQSLDVLYQLNRSDNVIDKYEDVIDLLTEGSYPEISTSSTSDFINGREIAVGYQKIIVAQDANDANGQSNQLVQYDISGETIALEKTFDVDINLWGIHLSDSTLWAIEDNSSNVAWYENFFSLSEGSIAPSGKVSIENMVRTHGLTYDAQEDIMILTDVGDAASADDGAFVLINNWSTAIMDGMVSADEQIRVAGPMTQLGNPVDVSYDFNTNSIFIAERANAGGRIMGFAWPTVEGDQAPVWSELFSGASAVYFSSARARGQYIPFDPQNNGRLLFTGRLSGSNEVPAATTEAVGVVGILLSEDMATASVNLSINGLTGDFTGVHLHEAAAGSNGEVLVNLTDQFNSNRISMTMDITPELLNKLMAGSIYINVHSTAFPDGEIRSQVVLEKDLSFVNWITGDQEMPAVSTQATGLVSANLTQVLNLLEVNAFFKDLSSHVIGAHLHSGLVGSNGDVVADLTTMVDGNVISGSVDATSFLSDLMDGNIYLNIHTENNPDGEIRAQLNMWSGITADGWLAGEQSVPAISTAGLGLMAVNLDPSRQNMTVWAVTDDLSDQLMAAHLHLGSQGMNGGVWIDLTPGISDDNINLIQADFDPANIIDFLSGNVYLNLHTSNYPDGEIRGQVYPLIRDSYNYSICSEQETIDVINADSATGGGIASLDRKGSNLHLMAVASGLSGDITGVHLHNAPAGEDGPVILGLTDLVTSGGVFLYYTEDEFDMNIGSVVRSRNAYINFHTADNPDGEIRGQIVKSLDCALTTSITDSEYQTTDVNIYPNPSQDYLMVDVDAGEIINQLEIYNAQGQNIMRVDRDLDRSQISLDVKNLRPGIYQVKIYTTIGIGTRRFIKL
ncbi:MAG: CHRD domain-containing protein [Saprospiraceae bacterium]|nr:CHRD domain-containing protein [Saprospiraceae bacterium]